MAIRTVVTRGYGNGTFNGTIALVVTRGYAISEAIPFVPAVILDNILINPTPTANINSNPSPVDNANSNPSPTQEVNIA